MTERKELILAALKKKMQETLPPNSRGVLYGSQARGDEHAESDWDIHILVPGKESLTFEEIGKYARPLEELGWDLNECFSVMVYSHEGWEKRKFLPFYKNVENDKIILFHSTYDSNSGRKKSNS